MYNDMQYCVLLYIHVLYYSGEPFEQAWVMLDTSSEIKVLDYSAG
jgi:hypothetical protein